MTKGNEAEMSKTPDARIKQRAGSESEKACRIIWKMEQPKFDWLRFPIASFFFTEVNAKLFLRISFTNNRMS